MNENDYRIEQVLYYIDSGQLQSAVDQLVELLGEHPDIAIFHGLLAACLIDQKRIVAAKHELDIGFELDPESAYLHKIRAELLVFERNLHQALETCDESLRLDPEDASTYLLKARIYQLLDQPTDVKNSIDKAASLDPDNIDIPLAYGDFYNSRGEYKTGYDYALMAMRADAANIRANLLMGETMLALGDSEQAEYHAKFSILQDPDNRQALTLFTNIRMRKNPFVGLWWRFSNWISSFGNLKSALILILCYLFFNIAALAAKDLGHHTLSSIFAFSWLILVIYSWISIPIYRKALKKELESFKFKSDF